MPKVRPLTQAQKDEARWATADRNFRAQLFNLEQVIGVTSRQIIGTVIGTTHGQTIKRFYDNPSRMTKKQERDFAKFFEENGVNFDMTWGEGAQHNAGMAH